VHELGFVDILTESRHERITKTLKVLARSGVCDVISRLKLSSCGFSQLMFEIKLNPGMLSRHLKTLTENAVIEKHLNNYELTEKGRKLVEILEEISKIERDACEGTDF